MPQDPGGGPGCVAGRGDQYIEHGGYTWRTLDGADPQGGSTGAPNGGCQCTDGGNSCPSNYLPLPAGWVLAPNDATSIAVVAAHRWAATCAVLADGTAWYSGSYPNSAGASCYSSNRLATSGGTYTVREDVQHAGAGAVRVRGRRAAHPRLHTAGGLLWGGARAAEMHTTLCLCWFVSRAMLWTVRLSLRTFAIRFRDHFSPNYSPFFGGFLDSRLNVQGAQTQPAKNAKDGSKNGRKTAAFLGYWVTIHC
eukprot:COSAG04_NODE_187_length_21001_cov_8.855277_3_plen_251_part_00